MARLDTVSYTSGDGETEIPSYLAVPDGDGPHPTVLILRGVAGPDDGYIEIARRLAGWGYAALLHGWKIRGANPPDGPVYDDLKGALAFLRSAGPVDRTRLGVFGFCRGGVSPDPWWLGTSREISTSSCVALQGPRKATASDRAPARRRVSSPSGWRRAGGARRRRLAR